MKYTEFGRKISFLGFQLDEDDKIILVSKRDGTSVAIVSITEEFAVDFVFNGFYSLRRDQKKDLVDLCYLLASTPLADREDEKLYRLIIPFVRDSVKYLTLSKTTGTLIITHPLPFYSDYQAEFTETEIKALKEKHNLDSFVMEEVLEDE